MKTDYSKIAERYDDSPLRKKGTDKYLSRFLKERGGPLKVIDVGCGTGTWLVAQMASHPHHNVVWYGADPSANWSPLKNFIEF